MYEPAPARPAAVTAIGVFSIVLAVLFLFGGLYSLAGAAFVRVLPTLPSGTVPPEAIRKLTAASHVALPRGLLQLVLGAALLVASLQFLRLQEAGRKALEALNWFGIVYVIGSAVYGVISFSALSRAMPGFGGNAPVPPAAFAAAAEAVWAVIQLIVIGIIIWQLRTPVVRNAMQPGGPRAG